MIYERRDRSVVVFSIVFGTNVGTVIFVTLFNKSIRKNFFLRHL